MWQEFMIATALLLIIEGILPFLNPTTMRQVCAMVLQMDDKTLRTAGFVSMMLGLIILYLVNE
ncbi:MAG: DUF2065 domain-containing protein [Gammaproteobacteria bacterium]|nr:DUF2065 domain-containing protein [Gammaproteobacteria bacterium]